MPSLLRTTKTKKHYHLVYIRRLEQAECSVEKPREHRHEIIFEYATDPETGLPAVNPQTEGSVPESITLAPAMDGHTHELIDIVGTNTVPEEAEDRTVADVLRLYQRAKEFENDAFESAAECEKFYGGDQWEETIKQKLMKSERAHLTINEIESKLDILGGYQRRNRTQLQYLPVEGGDEIGANLATLLVKHVMNQNEFPHEETRVFDDMLIAGRGAWDVDVDYNDNIEGEIIVKHRPWKKLRLGPHDDPRCTDLEYHHFTDMFSQAKVAQLWPEKKKEIGMMFWAPDGLDDPETQDDTPRVEGMQYDTPPLKDFGAMLESKDMIDVEQKNIRVIECWRKVYRRVFTVVDPESKYVFPDPLTDKSMADKVRSIPSLRAVPRTPFYMRVTTVAGPILLSDDIPELATQDFQVVIAYAKKRGKDWWGKMRPALDPQREMNKRISQSMDILNRAVVYSIYYDDKTFGGNRTDRKNFKDNATKPGALIKVANTDRPPVREQGAKFPSEVANMIVISRDTLREILSIGPAMQGLDTGDTSGIALIEKKKQGVIGNEFLFDNLSMAKRRLGKLLLALVQDVYSPQRAARIVMSQAARDASGDRGEMATLPVPGAEGEMEQKDLSEFSLEEITAFLQERDLTKYDVVAAEREWTPTVRRATFYEVAQMIQHGAPLPTEMAIDLSDLPKKEKDKAFQWLKEAQARTEATEKRKGDVEIEKSNIAAAGRDDSGGPQE